MECCEVVLSVLRTADVYVKVNILVAGVQCAADDVLVNKDLVTMIEALDIKACGISGKDGGLLKVRKKLISAP